MSTIDAPHVSEHHYFGNNSYVGNPLAFSRWDSFTTDGGADSFYNSTVVSQAPNADGTATLQLAGPVTVSVFFYTWHAGDSVVVMQGPGVGQVRRLVEVRGAANDTVVISAPFDPPLDPALSIVTITSYRGGYTFEGNAFTDGTCFQFYGGAFDVLVSGNSFNNMFAAGEAGVAPDLPSADAISVGSGIGGGGRVYATALQMEAYNIWEHNDMRCAGAFKITMGNLENGEAIKLPNATYNFAQIIRRNTWAGLARPAELRFTRDHVVEHNAHGPAACAYAGGRVFDTLVEMNATTNEGLVFRE